MKKVWYAVVVLSALWGTLPVGADSPLRPALTLTPGDVLTT
jgi:hypothetical protein